MRVHIPLQLGQCYVRFGSYSTAITKLLSVLVSPIHLSDPPSTLKLDR